MVSFTKYVFAGKNNCFLSDFSNILNIFIASLIFSESSCIPSPYTSKSLIEYLSSKTSCNVLFVKGVCV